MAEPNAGPTAAASAPTAPQTLTATACFSLGNAARTRASDEGNRHAAPAAWMIRPSINKPGEGAKPHAAEAAVKIHRPNRNVAFRPTLSASRPAVTRSAPKTMV